MSQKRLKQVLKNSSEVIQLYAKQSQNFACAKYTPRNGGPRSESCYFHDKDIYSYGSHYLLARVGVDFQGVNVAIVNFTPYSRTTSEHSSETFYALKHKGHLVLKISEETTSLAKRGVENADLIKLSLEYIKRDKDRLIESLEYIKTRPGSEYRIERLRRDCHEFNSLVSDLELKDLKINNIFIHDSILSGMKRLEALTIAKNDHSTRVQLQLDTFQSMRSERKLTA